MAEPVTSASAPLNPVVPSGSDSLTWGECVKLTKEQVMVAKAMEERGMSVRQLARQLEVTEGALFYRLKKVSEEGPNPSDRRADQATALDGYEDAVLAVQERLEDSRLTG